MPRLLIGNLLQCHIVQNPIVRRRLFRITGWRGISLVMLLIVVCWWWCQPKPMRMLASIPGDRDHEMAQWTPEGLYRWRWPAHSNAASTLTLYDWNGRIRWSRPGPAGISDLGWRQRDFACSPDGHIVAIALILQHQVRVMSWRDSRSLGEVSLPRQQGLYTASMFVNLTATDSGRLWLYHTCMAVCPITAVDGTHIATGILSIPHMKDDPPVYDWLLSPDKNTMAVEQGEASTAVRYLTVAVDEKRVKVVRTVVRHNARLFNAAGSDLYWNAHGFLLDSHGHYLNKPGWNSEFLQGTAQQMLASTPDITPADGTTDYRFFHRSNRRQWNIHAPRTWMHALCGTMDGRAVLTVEYRVVPLDTFKWLSQWPILDRLYDHLHSNGRFGLYTCPGVPRATFPLQRLPDDFYFEYGTPNKSSSEFAISPDTHRVAIEGRTKESSKVQYIILAW